MDNQPPRQGNQPSPPDGPIGIPEPDEPELPWRDDSDVPLDQEPPKPAEPAATPVQPEPPRSSRRWVFWVIVAAVVIATLAAYYLLHKSKTPAAKSARATSSQETTSQPAKVASQISTQSKSYTSSNFSLTFSYPSDWTVTDAGGGVMTVKSPALQLKSPSGQNADGAIVLTVRNHVQKLTEFNGGNATATRNSLKVAYTKPSQIQRGNTYLSFLQYATTTTSGALDGIYITGDSGYQKSQAIPMVDVQKVDPIISITFTDPAGKATAIADSAWDDTAFSGPLQTMLLSFTIN